MASSDRTIGQKALDSLFTSGAPFNLITSDTGRALSAQTKTANSAERMERHMADISRQLGGNLPSAGAHQPIYQPQVNVDIDMSEFAQEQHEGNMIMGDVLDTSRQIASTVGAQTPLFRRMISSQGISNQLTQVGNMQRGVLTEKLEHGFSRLGKVFHREAAATRKLLQQLLTDVGSQITELTNEQIITRMTLKLALTRMNSTFIETHEQQMLEMQKMQYMQAVANRIALFSEDKKKSHHLWEQAEVIRQRAQSAEEYNQVLELLKQAHEQDPVNPLVQVSAGTVQCAVGNYDNASVAFAEADNICTTLQLDPRLSSFVLLSLASSLIREGNGKNAELVMRKAYGIDKGNPQVLYQYARALWMNGNTQDAKELLRILVKKNGQQTLSQIHSDPIFT